MQAGILMRTGQEKVNVNLAQRAKDRKHSYLCSLTSPVNIIVESVNFGDKQGAGKTALKSLDLLMREGGAKEQEDY